MSRYDYNPGNELVKLVCGSLLWLLFGVLYRVLNLLK